jgi:Domain of unknown function (DUF4905)/PQQ-like domain
MLRLLKLLRKKEIRPAWRYAPGGILWRVFPSHPEVFVGEERDTDRKDANFFCLSRRTGEVWWQKKSFREQWWIGIESVGRDVVFLHRFAQPDMPGHKGIIAVDLLSGDELWRDDDLTIDQTLATSILASRMSMKGREQIALHARTGNLVGEEGAGDEDHMAPFVEAEIEFPEEADGSLHGYPHLSTFRDHLPPSERRAGPLEFVRVGSRTVLGYHERRESAQSRDPRFRHIILVGDRASGTTLFRDTIAANATGIVPESFFVQDGVLFFVKERRTLVAVNLNVGTSPDEHVDLSTDRSNA